MSGTMKMQQASHGFFVCEGEGTSSTSGKKRLYRGRYFQSRTDVGTPALLTAFSLADAALYGLEVSNLSRAELRGAGPALLAEHCQGPEPAFPLGLVAEDVGISLDLALFGKRPLPGDGTPPSPLHPVGSRERRQEVAKILFDVAVSLDNLHKRGMFHRDLRGANVCVRRHGPHPADVRATLIDFECGVYAAERETNRIAYANEPYRSLFRRFPAEMLERFQERGRGVAGALPPRPTALDLDMGYLAAMAYELETGMPLWDASVEQFVAAQGRWPWLGYEEDGRPISRRIDRRLDLEPLAQAAGIQSVEACASFGPEQREAIDSALMHGGYIDACDRERLRRHHPQLALFDLAETLGRQVYETYLARRAEQGRPVAYASFEDQPALLQASNASQARDVAHKVAALGYRIVKQPKDEGPALAGAAGDCSRPSEHRVIEKLTPLEVEYLAYLEHRRWCDERLANGWRYGEVRDDAAKVHDCLVPYDELSEPVKEYDRDPARNVIGLLRSAGYQVVAP